MWDIELYRRLRTLSLIAVIVIGLLVVRLAWMQILQGAQYKRIADQNRIHQTVIPAPRGTIVDRNGAILVTNRPSFAVSIVPADFSRTQEEMALLSETTGVPESEITAMLDAAKDYPYTPVYIKRDIDPALLAKIEERRGRMPGVGVDATPVRSYVYQQLGAHVLGYVGRISEEEFAKRKAMGYHPNDLVGKDGIELEWETSLRGVDGGYQVEVDAEGTETERLGEKSPEAGKQVVLTLDANLQKVAEDALNNQISISKGIGEPAKGGAIAVIKVKTGEVLAWASNPSYDPNLFAGGISSRDWNNLMNNANTPLADRVIQNAFPPGSVFKIVTSAAALDKGYTTGQEIFEDRGVYVLNGWSFYGWETSGLGKLTLPDALAFSSDPVFYELGHRMGPDTLASYALTFGFGQKTGVKLPGEVQGNVPTEQWKLDTYDEEWYPGETLIAAIGQGYYLATPLQQAMLLMAVANGGVVYRPFLVDRVVSEDGAQVLEQYRPEVLRTIYLKPEHWDLIRQGLAAVAARGTASSVFQGFSVPVAGKTGSAETGRGTTHAWFACYAPVSDPEIAVAVFMEDGGEGSVSAAPVARKILEAYFQR